MAIYHNKSYVPLAQQLRKEMTPEEKHLWYDFLKRLPFTVKRQHNIDNYIVDFYIPKKKTRAVWGSVSGTRKKLARRNRNIYEEYLSGLSVNELAARYYLTDKSIQRIIREIKREIE